MVDLDDWKLRQIVWWNVWNQLSEDYEPPEPLKWRNRMEFYKDIDELDIDLPMTKVVTLMDQTNFLNALQSFTETFKSFINPQIKLIVPSAEEVPASDQTQN